MRTYWISYKTNQDFEGCATATIELDEVRVKELVRRIDFHDNEKGFIAQYTEDYDFFYEDTAILEFDPELHKLISDVCLSQEQSCLEAGIYERDEIEEPIEIDSFYLSGHEVYI